MPPLLSYPFRFMLIALAGWQRDVIDYLEEENRVLREQLGTKRLRFTDPQPSPGSESQNPWTPRPQRHRHDRDT